MNEATSEKSSLRYENGKVTVTAVKEVASFDEKQAVLRLNGGLVTIKGNGFKLEEMGTKSGVFCMEATVSTVEYHEKAEKTSLLKKIFK